MTSTAMFISLINFVLLASAATGSLLMKRNVISDCLTHAKIPQNLPGSPSFTQAIIPYNLRLPFTLVAVAIPSTVSQVQAAVACGVKYNVTVSARSGGHSYASDGLGGEDGHLMIDMKLFHKVEVDEGTKIATIEPGSRLGNIALQLYTQYGRAISHGTCPGSVISRPAFSLNIH
jgi:FAD/FMN-containing dehydrogenase